MVVSTDKYIYVRVKSFFDNFSYCYSGTDIQETNINGKYVNFCFLEQFGITMPPWDVGAPDIYIIGVGNNITTHVPSTLIAATTTTTIEQTSIDMGLTTADQGPLNVTLILGEITTEDMSSMTVCKLAEIKSASLITFVGITGMLDSI